MQLHDDRVVLLLGAARSQVHPPLDEPHQFLSIVGQLSPRCAWIGRRVVGARLRECAGMSLEPRAPPSGDVLDDFDEGELGQPHPEPRATSGKAVVTL